MLVLPVFPAFSISNKSIAAREHQTALESTDVSLKGSCFHAMEAQSFSSRSALP
jgi:hypothetical protein